MLEGGIIGDIGTDMGSKNVISITCSADSTRLEDGDRAHCSVYKCKMISHDILLLHIHLYIWCYWRIKFIIF